MATQTLIEGLVAFLKADTGVSNLVGANVFPNEALQGAAKPWVILKRTAETDDQTLTLGASKQPTATVTAECWGGAWGQAPGYFTSRTLADAVLNATGGLGGRTLKSYIGLLGTVVCQSCRCTDDVDGDEPPIDATGRGQQSVTLTFSIAYIKQP